ncbi:hypothetical protein KUV80_18160 [Fictibacillus nanhaiensis]|uniref:hypothetical protein n=1 Tax=Fictibacillus nanhaiensis TaxID=742169 RepID=UPI001C980BF8|nr:hypothetical protein [Fictibacillus nanhaiensis]MBY6038562.1 hypothetical protein [Fictibacillus nanhaiensis]
MKTRLKPFLAGFAVFTLLVIQFTPVVALASINPWEGNPWEGKEFEGNPWEGNTWEGNTFEKDSFEKDSFNKDSFNKEPNNTNPNDPANPNNPNNPGTVDPNNPSNPSTVDPNNPNNPEGPGDSNNPDPSDPSNPDPNSQDSDSGDQPAGKESGNSKDPWDGIKWAGQIFTDQFAFASKMLEDQNTMEWKLSRGELAEDMSIKNLKYLGLDTALLFAKNLSKGTFLETPFDMAYDGRDIAKNVSPAAQAMKDSWAAITKTQIVKNLTGGTGMFTPPATQAAAPVLGIVSKLNVGVAAAGTIMGGIDTFKSFQKGDTVDGIGNLGSTLMNAGVVAAAIPGVQAAAPFIIAGGAVLYGGAMVVKHSKTIAKAAQKTYEFAKSGVKAIGDGVKSIAKGLGSLFG